MQYIQTWQFTCYTFSLQQAGLSVLLDMVINQPLNTVDFRYHVIKSSNIQKGIQKGLQEHRLNVEAVTIFQAFVSTPYNKSL